jgi:hypothetical protein
VELEGISQGRRQIYRSVVTLPMAAEDHEALGRLWARARIHQLERELHDGERPEAVEAITTLGLSHRLMTAYTSLVAVDSEISNWMGRSSSVSVPVEMPEDVSYEGILGAEVKAKNVQQIYPRSAAAALSSLGYLGVAREEDVANGSSRVFGSRKDSAPAVPGTAVESSKVEPPAAAEAPTAQLRPAFTSITVFETAEQGWMVQEDGQLFKLAGGRKTYVKTLGEEDMESIRNALSAARTTTWSGGGAGPRIVLQLKQTTRVVGLPSEDAAVQALAALLRSLVG